MPVDPNARVRISAFNWVPPLPRARSATSARAGRSKKPASPMPCASSTRGRNVPPTIIRNSPLVVPSYRDETVALFESGAIVLHTGRDCETLLPADPAGRCTAG